MIPRLRNIPTFATLGRAPLPIDCDVCCLSAGRNDAIAAFCAGHGCHCHSRLRSSAPPGALGIVPLIIGGVVIVSAVGTWLANKWLTVQDETAQGALTAAQADAARVELQQQILQARRDGTITSPEANALLGLDDARSSSPDWSKLGSQVLMGVAVALGVGLVLKVAT